MIKYTCDYDEHKPFFISSIGEKGDRVDKLYCTKCGSYLGEVCGDCDYNGCLDGVDDSKED